MIRNVAEKAVVVISWAMTLILCAAVLFFVGYLLRKGLPSLGPNLIFGQVDPLQALLGRVRVFDGIFAAIVGTLYLVMGSTVLAVPVGVCSGIYLAEYAGLKTKKLFGFFFDILAGIPSISASPYFYINSFRIGWVPACSLARCRSPCLYFLILFEAHRYHWKTYRRTSAKPHLPWAPPNSRTLPMY